MPTAEQMTLTKPGTHLYSPLTFITVRTSDPAAPDSGQGATLYYMLSTASRLQLKIIFPGGTPQVIAQSTG